MGEYKTKHIGVIGSGFSGLAAACTLAQKGYKVTVLEKNTKAGGRGRSFSENGFTFDMGPSWYWMPEIIENFFHSFGKSTQDYYQLQRLDPGYRVFLKDNAIDISAHFEKIKQLFESIEAGAGQALERFLNEAENKYNTGMGKFVIKPSHSILEFAEWDLLKALFQIQLFTDMRSHLKSYFKNPILLQLLEFPVLFLGAQPSKTPALYSLMNHADLKLGTWYPMGGMAKIPEAMIELALSLGVEIQTDQNVKGFEFEDDNITAIQTNTQTLKVDGVVASADYHHVEQHLLPKKFRQYDEAYWSSRTMSPSSLIFYVGLNTKVPGLEHHNLFFESSFDKHAEEIYVNPQWPTQPLFYLCCPSKTDDSVAPENHENLFFLIPVAPDMSSEENLRDKYWDMLREAVKRKTGVDIQPHVVYKRSFAHEEFVSEYNSYKGNAYGLANTLQQTAFLKPKMKSAKLNNLFYAGQLTVPGPGMPPGIISGQLAANEIAKIIQ